MVRAVADAIGPERTALRLSPGLATGGIVEGRDNDELYHYLAVELEGIAWKVRQTTLRANNRGTVILERSMAEVDQAQVFPHPGEIIACHWIASAGFC